MSARAGIVVTGTEVLTGVINDRNGPWLGGELERLGVQVAQICVVGDRREDMLKALRWLQADGVDLIVTSGGLGPTEDDLTVSVVAEFHGRQLIHDAALEGRINVILERVTKRWPDIDRSALARSATKQATIPDGASVLEPVGTAPGMIVSSSQDGQPTVLVLPGPPGELQPMWQAALDSGGLDDALSGRVVRQRTVLRMVGVPESDLARVMRDARADGIDVDALEITTCLRKGELEVDSRYEAELTAVYEDFEAFLIAEMPGKIFSTDGSTVDAVVARLLVDHGLTVAVAESLTGGAIAARLTETEGASAWVQGGVVAYSVDAKEALLGVGTDVVDVHGVVSVEVAAAMAAGALARFGSGIALGITGEAGPESASGRPVGTVCIATMTADGRSQSAEMTIPGRRADIRERAVTGALHALRTTLQRPA